MTCLGAVMSEAIVHHYGRDELLRRLAHPFWFQSFGAVMGMDWHASLRSPLRRLAHRYSFQDRTDQVKSSLRRATHDGDGSSSTLIDAYVAFSRALRKPWRKSCIGIVCVTTGPGSTRRRAVRSR
jgi:hypothetical protein